MTVTVRNIETLDVVATIECVYDIEFLHCNRTARLFYHDRGTYSTVDFSLNVNFLSVV